MSTRREKEIVIGLRKALKVAKEALERINCSGDRGHASAALDEIHAIEWRIVAPSLQGLVGHERRPKA